MLNSVFVVLIGAILINNYAFAQFLGIYPFLGVSSRVETSVGTSIAVTFVVVFASATTWILQRFILNALSLEYLQTIVFILIIASLVQFVKMVIKKMNPALCTVMGVYLPLITTNCVVLGVTVLNIQNDYGFIETLFSGLGASIEFDLALVLIAALREYLEIANLPRPLQSVPITLISTGLMAMASGGLAGLIWGGQSMLGEVIHTAIVLAIIRGVFGALLGIVSRIFYVKIDKRVVNVLDALPRTSCGACGFPGCEGLANAVIASEATVNARTIGGQEVAGKVANAMGVNAGDMERKVAAVRCQGSCSKTKNRCNYEDLVDCRLINDYVGGSKSYGSGCLDGGTCAAVYEFDAIHIIDGIAQVDREKCVACRKCIDIYSKNIIGLIPHKQKTEVKCSTKDPEEIVRTNCSIGCIACKLCGGNCPKGAIHVEGSLAKIGYDKCINHGICAAKCPTGTTFVEYPERVEKIREAAKKKAAAAVAKKKKEMAAAQAKAATGTLEKKAEK